MPGNLWLLFWLWPLLCLGKHPRHFATAFGRFFFACVFLLPLSAHAAQLELGVGIAHSRDHGDGTWYQSAFPHTLTLTSPLLQIGVVGDAAPWLRWHVDAVYLGRYAVDSLDTPNDANYNPHSPTGCNGKCLPLTRYIGSGSVWGIAATLEAHTQGAWQWGIEAGPLLYHRTWSLSVPDWYPSTQMADGTFQPGKVTPISTSDAGWTVGGVVGLSVRRKDLGVSLRYYSDGKGFPRGSDAWPPLWQGQTVLMLTYAF